MPWKPLSNGLGFAICVHPFHATLPDDLPLQIGDQIYIIEQGGKNDEWYRGYLLSPPSLLAGLTSGIGQQLEHRVFTGIFPGNCVEVREVVREGGKDGQQGNGLELGETTDYAPDDEEEDEQRGEGEGQDEHKRRKDQARRLSRVLNKHISARDLVQGRRDSRKLLTSAAEPLLSFTRDHNGPKPMAPVPMLRVGDETGASAEEPLVDEIASCLREWHDARLHEILLARGYPQLANVQELVRRVDTNRKQLMHDVMTAKELAVLREDTVWDLVAGNKLLEDGVIVRSPTEKGRILTSEDSVIEMTKLQANMSILDRPPKPQIDMSMLHHVLIDLRNLVYDDQTPASLHMYLCVKEFGEKARPVTESYAISIPLPDTPPEDPAEMTKTFFTELSATDVGSSGDTSQMFLVLKLTRDESLRRGTPMQLNTDGPGGRMSRSSQKERFSILGSQKKKEAHSRSGSESTIRPPSAQSSRSEAEGRYSSATDAPFQENQTAKRIIGIGAIELTQLARQQSELETQLTIWGPCSTTEDRSEGSDDWVEVIRELSTSNPGGFARVGLINRMDVFAAAFAASDIDTLVRNTPTLLHNVHQTQKLGFSGVPSKKRSDIYLTLTEPLIDMNPCLQHSKFGNVPLQQRCQTNLANLQLTLEVRKASGERFEGCVFTASNHQGHTAWRTTAVERGEVWNQTIRLSIPADEVPGSHIVMSLADSPNFPFALGWIPLWDSGAFVRDGDHQVALYVYDEYSSSMVAGKGAYLSLPPWHQKDHDPGWGSSVKLAVRTFLCSTEYSQDPNLLGLLKWRDFHGQELIGLLERFSFVPEIEVAKLLSEVFNALFEILDEYAGSENYEDITFHNFAIIMSIARDRRFNLTNAIEQFALTRHDWPNASQSLLRAYYRLLTNPLDPAASRRLRATLKVGDQMLKLILDCRRTRADAENGLTNGASAERYEHFHSDLSNFFVAIMALLRNPMPILLGTQTLIVQHFHSWLPQLESIMPPTEIMEIATNLLDASAQAQGKMILHRLILIINFSYLEIFKAPEVRTTLIANTFRWLAPYWGTVAEVDEQWRDQVRLCCSVVAAQMAELGDESCQYVPKLVESFAMLEKVQRQPKRTFSLLFPTSLPFSSKTCTFDLEVDEAMLEISALLAAAMTSGERLYFDANQIDVPGVLLEVLKVQQSILSGEAFPKTWLSLHASHHRHIMRSLERIADVLIDCLPDIFAPDAAEAIEFDTPIWRAFFETLFAAVSSPSLAMETFPEQKRRAVWKIAGDVRELGANLIRRSWEAIGWETDDESKALHGFERLGGYQVQFVPDLVPPIVEICLSVHASLRGVAVEVLRSMIVGTWEMDEDLSMIQSAIINSLDKICRKTSISKATLQQNFHDEVVGRFRPLQGTTEDALYVAVVEMFSKIEELLGMLAAVHHGGSMNEANKIMDTINLMQFFKDVQSDDAYVRYVHQLADLQVAASHHAEAGLALKLHADRYEWDPSRNVPAIAAPSFPAQTAFERKETLFFEMCRHFEAGQAWNSALIAYKELAQQYETTTFDFSKLARAQRAMAAVHERIAKGERANPRFFRVVFKGLGFSVNLLDREFIYEGLSTDRQATFEERLQQMYPTAQILRTAREPDVEGQFIQIFPVSPNKDLEHVIYQRTKVSPAAREHSLLSNPRKFTTSTRHLHPDVPVTDQVVEKTVYTTAEPFPTILRRSEIVQVENVTLSQVQAAVERTTRKTQELLALEKRTLRGKDEGAMSRLTEDLLLSVDPNSDSSVSKYRNLLPASEQTDAVSQEIDFAELENGVGDDEDEKDEDATPRVSTAPIDPMQNALKVALLDHVLAIRRCLSLFSTQPYLSARAELIPRFEATFPHELASLFPGKSGLMEILASPRASMSLENGDDPSNHPAIEVSAPQTDLETTADADAETATQTDRPRRRTSRRPSFSFLRRLSSSQNRQTSTTVNGGGYDSESIISLSYGGDRGGRGTVGGGGSRAPSRRPSSRGTRARSRSRSLSRPLSWFRSESHSRVRTGQTGLSSDEAAGMAAAAAASSAAPRTFTGAGAAALEKEQQNLNLRAANSASGFNYTPPSTGGGGGGAGAGAAVGIATLTSTSTVVGSAGGYENGGKGIKKRLSFWKT